MALITITIAGRSGTGKSTIATLIAQLLEQQGVPMHHEQPDEPLSDARGYSLTQRLDFVIDRLKRERQFVHIKEIAVNRDPSVRTVGVEMIENLVAERDEADRRAGAAERKLVKLQQDEEAQRLWYGRAKAAAGYDDNNVSFDVVWDEALAALKEKRERQHGA